MMIEPALGAAANFCRLIVSRYTRRKLQQARASATSAGQTVPADEKKIYNICVYERADSRLNLMPNNASCHGE